MPQSRGCLLFRAWKVTLPEKEHITPENGWLEYLFPYWDGLFSGVMAVSFSNLVVLGSVVMHKLQFLKDKIFGWKSTLSKRRYKI